MTPVSSALFACGILNVDAGAVGRAHSTESETKAGRPCPASMKHSASGAAVAAIDDAIAIVAMTANRTQLWSCIRALYQMDRTRTPATIRHFGVNVEQQTYYVAGFRREPRTEDRRSAFGHISQ